MAWPTELQPFPYINQLNEPTADERTDENREENCGPSCVSAVVEYLTGVFIFPDTVKDMMYPRWPEYIGYTDVWHLQAFLKTYCGIPSTMIDCSADKTALQWWIWNYLNAGKPLIELYYGTAIGVGGHFKVDIGGGNGSFIEANPWGGTRDVQSYADHMAWSQGWLLGIDRTRCSQLSAIA